MVDIPLFYRILHIPGGAGFLYVFVLNLQYVFSLSRTPRKGVSPAMSLRRILKEKNIESNSSETLVKHQTKCLDEGLGHQRNVRKIVSKSFLNGKNIRINLYFKKKTKIPQLQKFVIFFEKKVEFLAILLVTFLGL